MKYTLNIFAYFISLGNVSLSSHLLAYFKNWSCRGAYVDVLLENVWCMLEPARLPPQQSISVIRQFQ